MKGMGTWTVVNGGSRNFTELWSLKPTTLMSEGAWISLSCVWH